MNNLVLFLSFEAESYMFVDLHDWLKNKHGISSFIVNCDISSFVNHSARSYYPPGFKDYVTLESVYKDLHQTWDGVDMEYLEKCEQKYGSPKTLNEVLMSHQDVNFGCRFPCATPLPNASIKLKYLELTLRWAEKIISDKNPSIVFTLERNYYIKNMMFQVCRSIGIPFKTLISSRVLGKYYVSSCFGYGNLGAGEEVLQRFRNLAEGDLKSKAREDGKIFISDYVLGIRMSPYNAAATRLIEQKDRALSYINILSSLQSRAFSDVRKALKKKKFRGRFKYNWMDNSPVRKIGWRIRIAANKIKYKHFGSCVFFTPTESFLRDKYVYYALHTLPESSTLTLSTEYNELELIAFLRRKLPVHIPIVVKENPNMLGERPFRFYHDLKKLPNLVLVDPFYPSSSLVRHASGVAGISGSSLFEAAMFGKPTLAFGIPEFYPLVTCKGREDVERFIQFCNEGVQTDLALTEEYVSACITCGYDIDRNSLVRGRKGKVFEQSRIALRQVVRDILAEI